ncbi:MAG: bifunctional diaminohydroxyphosphoribosylaminopyrimidine deaminase/5-amino-6-(5-phosphoribosylamino)uracil reductase RibD [Pseudobdellovibrionaceae bacterium]
MQLTLDEAMLLAIDQAKLGASFVSPNPLVGCVILNSKQELLAMGHHQKYGEAHAEINALKGLNPDLLKDAHVIVTLEPCAHQGKTGSCAKKLIEFPIARVTYGLQDPFPQVSGKGAQILRDAGISCVNYSSSSENPKGNTDIINQLRNTCEIFLKNIEEQKIFFAVKLAQSLDGKMGLANGDSKWITSAESRQYSHYLRSCYDLLIVGNKTVSVDDPQLNIRHPKITKQNRILIIDPQGQLFGKDLQIQKIHLPENVFWAVQDEIALDRARKTGVLDSQVLLVPVERGQSSKLDLIELTSQLWAKGFRSAMIEGGAKTISHFLKCGLVDRIHLFQAPVILGGHAPGWAESLLNTKVQLASRINPDFSQKLGPDFYVTGRLIMPKNES